MSLHHKKVLIIVGPGGSGKSTLAQHTAKKLGWEYVEEDNYWVSNDWGHGLRTNEQETEVQKQVITDIKKHINEDKGVVLEFILYKNPPNPLTNYQKMLSKHTIKYAVIALKPSVDEILHRMVRRGRKNDLADIEARRKDADSQIRCLEEEYIAKWTIDSTNMTIDELYETCLSRIN